MSTKFDFVSTTDKPALLAFSTPEWLEAARTALNELGYKVHTAATHGDFLIRFSQVRYQVVIVEELFAANQPGENLTLQALQRMPMPQRRHATVILDAGLSAERSCGDQQLGIIFAQATHRKGGCRQHVVPP
ncbi:MAG: hypothetical protein DME25_20075 [Verrucomicrobia bacterium]|nr:MAG: hypothetical protein DME25_20075 [Verrucomicrobiota bacterium]